MLKTVTPPVCDVKLTAPLCCNAGGSTPLHERSSLGSVAAEANISKSSKMSFNLRCSPDTNPLSVLLSRCSLLLKSSIKSRNGSFWIQRCLIYIHCRRKCFECFSSDLLKKGLLLNVRYFLNHCKSVSFFFCFLQSVLDSSFL